MGLKLVSFYPANPGTGVPTHITCLPRSRRADASGFNAQRSQAVSPMSLVAAENAIQ